jgi:hypothetical protein
MNLRRVSCRRNAGFHLGRLPEPHAPATALAACVIADQFDARPVQRVDDLGQRVDDAANTPSLASIR